MADGRLLLDVADAVSLNRPVDWERGLARSRGPEHRAIANLQALANLLAPRRVESREEDARAFHDRPRGATGLLRLTLAVAAFEAVASLGVLPWIGDAYHREYGAGATFLVTILIAYSSIAVLLLAGGRRDERAHLFGVLFALMASMPAAHLLPFALWGATPAGDVMYTTYVHPFVFRPMVLWMFVREFPRARPLSRIDDVAKRMTVACAFFGAAVLAGFILVHRLAMAGALAPEAVTAYADAGFASLTLLDLTAITAVLSRARGAQADEVTRVVLFGGGHLLWAAGSSVYDAVEALRPGFFVANVTPSAVVFSLGATRILCIAVMVYAVLARRALDLQVVLRSTYRRLLTRRLLVLVAAAPPAGLAWRFVSDPGRTVGDVLADPWIGGLLAVTAGGVAILASRRSLLTRLDAWVYPESEDQRRLLAASGAAFAQAAQASHVGEVIVRLVERGCGAPACLLDANGTSLCAAPGPGGGPPPAPLPHGSAIAHVLEATHEPLSIDPADSASAFDLLPPEDATWGAGAAAAVVVPVFGSAVTMTGMVVVGRRFDDRLPSNLDVAFIETLASSAGLALDRLRMADASGEADGPAYVCPGCGSVTAADAPRGCGCTASAVEAPVPAVLAGKFRLTRRLGTGGMGTVYLARDVGLARDVAIKTLERASASGVGRLKQEALVLAAVSHAGIAQIHGIESWCGRPLLVVEYLAGGTLADRLRAGPLSAAVSVGIVLAVAEALVALHEAGYLHGDVKPNNIGFTSQGTPKLLDFGLARLADAGGGLAGGTVPYLSPEVLGGFAPAAADDVWALGVVLYEMVAGRHPFAAGGACAVTERIRRRRVKEWPAAAGDEDRDRETVLGFAASMLEADRAARPATAHAFGDALRAL